MKTPQRSTWSLLLVAVVIAGCTGARPTPIPTPTPFRLPPIPTFAPRPTFDLSALLSQLDDNTSVVGPAVTPPPMALSLQNLLSTNRIPVFVPPPTQANAICDAMGVHGADNVASEGIGSVIEHYRGLTEESKSRLGLFIGAVFFTCKLWEPALQQALQDILGD